MQIIGGHGPPVPPPPYSYGPGLARRETGLSLLQNIFTDRSNAVLLLWIISVISVLFLFCFRAFCLLMPCGHLLGKG